MIKYVRSIFLAVFTLLLFTGTANALVATKNVSVVDRGETKFYTTGANNVEEFLIAEKISLDPNDKINVPLKDELLETAITKIEITRAINVNVSIDGKLNVLSVPKDSLAGTLISQLEKKSNVKLVYDGSLVTVLKQDMLLTLKSISTQTLVTKEVIAFDTQIWLDEDYDEGKVELSQMGVNGEKTVTTVVTTAFGQVPTSVITEKIDKEPVMRLIRQGVKQKPAPKVAENANSKTVSASQEADFMPVGEGGAIDIVNQFTMNASAYHAGVESTGKRPGDKGYGITASGAKARYGIVAVDPSVIPLGTKLYIEGYGEAIAGDTGGSIKGMKIDLFFSSYDECIQFGRRNIDVYVLAE